jgi:hypothetical protein
VIFHDPEFTPAYSQVGLCDAEDPEAYPQWEDDDEEKSIGPKGVAVGAWWGSGETKVAVTAWEGPGDPGTRHLCTTTIAVGGAGLELGIEYDGLIPWPPGQTRVSAYADAKERMDIRRIDFVLEHLAE